MGQLDWCGSQKWEVGVIFNDGPSLVMAHSVVLELVIALGTAPKSIPSACSTQFFSAARQRSILACPGQGQEPLKPLLAVWSSVCTELFGDTAVLALREYSVSRMELVSS